MTVLFSEATLWDLAGPAAGSWYALVLSSEHAARDSVPELLVAPVCPSLGARDASDRDVCCPADISPTGTPLVIAAWAVAPMPAHCLSREIGVLDRAIVEEVRQTNARLLARSGLRAGHGIVPDSGRDPAWHRQLRASLKGYWDGSVMISCASLPDEKKRKVS